MQNIIEIIKGLLSSINKSKGVISNDSKGSTTEKTVVDNKLTTNKEVAMYSFSNTSRERLNTCHPDLIAICEEVIKIYDFSVLEGLRPLEKQQEYYRLGRSKLDGIKKKSNHQDDGSGRSRAVDLMPFKKGSNAFSGKEKDNRRFYYLAGLMKMTAHRLKVEGRISHNLRWGGDWDSDDIYSDQNFDDLPHFELIK